MNGEKLALVTELHKPARRDYPRRRVDVRGIDETWQADLVDMITYAGQNKGYKYMLTIIDIFSKYAWAVPIKSKSGDDVTKAIESVLVQRRVPKKLHVDRGTEFYNSKFGSLMTRYGVKLYSTKMWTQFSMQGSYKWLDILSDLVLTYNNTKHRTIRMKPSDVMVANERQLLRQAYGGLRAIPIKPTKFRTGVEVRISKFKNVFEKGYTPNWTTEIFTISRVENTHPLTYNLKDYQNQPIAGGFYEQELLKVEHPDIYLVEKVLKKREKKLYVEWLGFNCTHNSWINESDVLRYGNYKARTYKLRSRLIAPRKRVGRVVKHDPLVVIAAQCHLLLSHSINLMLLSQE
ncbi:uncharacterized protein LOC124413859 [Diprion similis]|uniref:uncharacterized protein LOC124413859 n=1 Tax=Diprion similis TaxID=362088 RepID=UPI001EF8A08B|nr:uncharacterized protein LOC124413859 [Diprion similis]